MRARDDHPEPCSTPACPFPIGSIVVVIEGRYTGLVGRVEQVNRCGVDAGSRHIAICECQVILDKHPSRPMWFRYDRELVADECNGLGRGDEAQRALKYEERVKLPGMAPGGSGGILEGGRP